MICTLKRNKNKKFGAAILRNRVLLTGSMPTLPPGAKASLSHSLGVGTPGLPARMRFQQELSCFSAYSLQRENKLISKYYVLL